MSFILCFVIFIISSYLIIPKIYKSFIIYPRKSFGKGVWNIPGPIVLPFLGTKWIFLWNYTISKLHEAYIDLNNKYGSILLEVTSSGFPVVNLFDKDDIEKVVRHPSKFPLRPPTEIVTLYRKSRPDRYCSMGITNEQGPKWYELRSKLTPHITSPRVIQKFVPALNNVCDDFIMLLRQRRDIESNVICDFSELANLMGLESICTFILGRRMGFLSDESCQPHYVKELSAAVKDLFIAQRDSYFAILGLWKHLPSEMYRKFCESENIIYRIISELVDKSLEDENLESSTEDIQSVFMNILHSKDLDIKDKKSAIIDFIAAGIETTANTLIFMLYYIINDKTAVKKISTEFEGASIGSPILEEHINNAVFTKACMKEVYRIQPTAFCLARILEEDLTLSNYDLKAGTAVLCHNMIACRNEKNFKNAIEFLPERWIEENFDQNLNSPIIAPFGIGKRMCPGKRFVELQLTLAIAKLLTSFDIEFNDKLEMEFEFLLAPKTPVSMKFHDRIN